MRPIARLSAVIRRYPRRFWTLLWVQFIVAMGFGAAMPFVSLYLHTQLGVPMTIVGFIMLVSALVCSIARLLGGEVADRFGRRPLLLVGMGSRVVMFALMTTAIHLRWSIVPVAVIFLLIRFVGDMVRPGLMAIVSDVVPGEHRVEAYALFRIGSNAGWAIGPAIGGFLISVSYASLFLLTTCASLIGVVLVALFIRESIRTTETARFALRRVLDVGRDLQFLVFCVWGALLFVVMGQFSTTLAVFSTQSIGISASQLGWLFTVNGVAVVLFQFPAARLAARVGIRWGLVLGCLGYALGYFSVGLVPSFGFLIGSMIIITLGEVTFSPTSMAAVANMAPEARVGRYMGFFGLTESLGWSLGPFLGGVLFDRMADQPVTMWAMISSIGVLAALGFLFTYGRRASCPDQPSCAERAS